jgi:ABC-type glutathione transport system ATPase component
VTPLLSVRGLTKRFGSERNGALAVSDVSFDLQAGGSLAIVGESGSGKTTTARMVIGLERPTSGTISFRGEDRTTPARHAKDLRRRGREVQIVFQDPYTSLDRRQRIGDCLAEVVRLHFPAGADDVRRRVRDLGALVGLDDRQLGARPAALSGGQRQRVAIARALAAEPEVLILDEAVSALDVSIQAQIINLLADIRAERGISYLFISHDLAVVRQITDDTIVMRHGCVVEQGPTGRLLDAPTHSYTRLLRDSVPTAGWSPLASNLIASTAAANPKENP